MMQPNLIRMIALADEVFSVKSDPTQLAVDDEVMARLRLLHPATMSEEATEEGPVAWALVIPTTRSVMERFIAKQITERELLDETPPDARYEAVYLCSALVLPEYRKRGITKRLLVAAVEAVRVDHPITALYCWAFNDAGGKLAAAVAKETGLELVERRD